MSARFDQPQAQEPSWLWTTVKWGLVGGAAVAGVAYADEIGDGIEQLAGVDPEGTEHWANKVDKVLNQVSGYAEGAGGKIQDTLGYGDIKGLEAKHTDKLTAIIAATMGTGALSALVRTFTGKGTQDTSQHIAYQDPRNPRGGGRSS